MKKSSNNVDRSAKRKKILIATLVAVVLAAIGVGIWQFLDLRSRNSTLQMQLDEKTSELETLRQDLITDPNTAVSKIQQEQNASILDAIAEVYAVPDNETPTIATVQDVSKLKDQPFFNGAQNGDILVVFSESSQAVLYRPETKQLVKVGPISNAAQEKASENTAEQSNSEE